MAMSKCPKCTGTTFEMVEKSNISGSAYKIMFIQCTNCGAVVGTTDFYNIPTLLEKIAKKIGFNLHS